MYQLIGTQKKENSVESGSRLKGKPDFLTGVLKKFRSSKSLRAEIGFLYVLLAIVNIIFFSVMIFENQMDLLINNFKYHSENIVKSVTEDLERHNFAEMDEAALERLKNALMTIGVKSFYIFDDKENIRHRVLDTSGAILEVPENLNRKIKELTGQSSILNSKYLMELNNRNFTVQFLISMKRPDGTPLYFYSAMSVKLIIERLHLLYFQIGLAVIWGIAFHIFFAMYLFKVIFSRLTVLQDASFKMGQGNLQARADWNKSRDDELDNLGETFNLMAGKIEDTVTKITKINNEIQMELIIGKQVQELFLPSNKIFRDFKIAVHYRPMREVSGDIYQFYQFNEKLKGFFLADATGHGVSAALVTSVITMNLNSIVNKTIHPIKVIKKLSARMNEVLQTSFFASAVFFVYDSSDKKILLSNAGHPAPFWFSKSRGTVREFPITGGILGISDEPEELQDFSGVAVRVESGDKLVFYTDGVTEATNLQNEMFTLERAKQIFLENAHLSNQEILQALLGELESYVHEFNDDVTIIVLEIP